MVSVSSNGRTFQFDLREDVGGTDAIVIREAFGENTYALYPEDFAYTGVMVDIGANIGAVSLLAVSCGAREVIAYEPEPDNQKQLLKNLFLNRITSVTVCDSAIWSSTGEIPIVPAQGGSTSDPKAVVASEKVIRVPCITLEEALASYDNIDVLKCDTEGAEYEILTDPSVLKKARKIVVEFHGATKEKVGTLLATLLETHNVHVFGSWKTGGQISAIRY